MEWRVGRMGGGLVVVMGRGSSLLCSADKAQFLFRVEGGAGGGGGGGGGGTRKHPEFLQSLVVCSDTLCVPGPFHLGGVWGVDW